MYETPPRAASRQTPPHARPFSRPEGVPAQRTPLSTRAVLFVPGERHEPHLAAQAAENASVEEDDFGFPELPFEPPEGDGYYGGEDEAFQRAVAQLAEQGQVSLGVAPAGDAALARATGTEAGERREVGEEVARVLESLAHRVRAGEITITASVSGASEGAILAALLAALLAGPVAAREMSDVAMGDAGEER